MKLCTMHWNRVIRIMEERGLDPSNADRAEAAVADSARAEGGDWLKHLPATRQCPACAYACRSRDILVELFNQLDDDRKQWRAHCDRCEQGGNDGADVHEAEEFSHSMIAKYGELWVDAVKEART